MSQNPYYKKYLKYKLKYNNLKNKFSGKYAHKPTVIIKHSLIQVIIFTSIVYISRCKIVHPTSFFATFFAKKRTNGKFYKF